jgi:FtsP/CotA-like multicopper oxidase with cupredoxin domain
MTMNRRDFLLTGLAGSAALLAPMTLVRQAARAQGSAPSPLRLDITSRTLEVRGKAAKVFGLAQPNGTPGLVLRAGTTFDVALANRTEEATLVHWHGLTPPWELDGVPDNPAALLRPAEERRYQFAVGAGGTHWMHAHTLQEQNLLAAPLIVRTAEDEARDEQEVVLLLHDFSFSPAEALLAKLKGASGGAAETTGHAGMDGMAGMMSGGGHGMSMPGMTHGSMPGMTHGAMAGMDLNDIEYDAYLANDRTLEDPEVVTVEKRGRVRLRIINGATATAFTIDLGSLTGDLIAVDGQAVQPVKGRRFPMTMGQRLDIRLELPADGGAFPVLALREGGVERTGVVLATKGASVVKLGASGAETGPVLDLTLEQGLKALHAPPNKKADLKYSLVLRGDMAKYEWSIDGADGLRVRRGQRTEVTFRNMSMMAHPMHLHGHHFQVVAINGKTFSGAVRDTVLVPSMAAVTVVFDADNTGRWPLHCHHLYHMASGMMAYVQYDVVG